LPEAVRTGASWPERHHGVGGYERLADDAQARTVFHHAMVELTRHAAPALVPLFELESVGCVADVGGGQGELLGAVLQQAPAARGVLLDHAAALEGAAEPAPNGVCSKPGAASLRNRKTVIQAHLRVVRTPAGAAHARYRCVLAWKFALFSAARFVAYPPAIWAIWSSGDSQQHSLRT
jgi:hypothetical protein